MRYKYEENEGLGCIIDTDLDTCYCIIKDIEQDFDNTEIVNELLRLLNKVD